MTAEELDKLDALAAYEIMRWETYEPTLWQPSRNISQAWLCFEKSPLKTIQLNSLPNDVTATQIVIACLKSKGIEFKSKDE